MYWKTPCGVDFQKPSPGKGGRKKEKEKKNEKNL